jgi:hypothetical protein
MRAKITFLVALYDGVRLIFVWLLLSYQYIYVIAHIICNHPVYRLHASLLPGSYSCVNDVCYCACRRLPRQLYRQLWIDY